MTKSLETKTFHYSFRSKVSILSPAERHTQRLAVTSSSFCDSYRMGGSKCYSSSPCSLTSKLTASTCLDRTNQYSEMPHFFGTLIRYSETLTTLSIPKKYKTCLYFLSYHIKVSLQFHPQIEQQLALPSQFSQVAQPTTLD